MRSVQFHDEISSVREFEVDEGTPNEDLWFTPSEYCDIKRNSRTESRDWRKLYGHMLKDCYESPKDDTEDFLLAFCLMQNDSYRRGLERQCNRQHSEERSDVKDRSRFIVFSQQSKLQRQKVAAPEIMERIAEQYGEACLCAKTFAIRIAKADEVVASGKMDPGTVEKLVAKPAPQVRRQRRPSALSIQSGNTYDSRLLVRRPWKSTASMPSPDEDAYAAIA